MALPTSDNAVNVTRLGSILSTLWGKIKTKFDTKADTSATVSNIAYDSTNTKLTKTINGTTTDIVTAATLKGAMSLNNVTNDAQVKRSEMGTASGVATLDANGIVPTAQLPSYVNDVLEYSAKSSFPATGETGKIYVDTSTNLTWRWSGTTYTEISPSLALGETSSTAYYGDKGKIAYDHSQSTHARTDATKTESSPTNGNIKINGTETTVYTHPTTTAVSAAATKVGKDSSGHVVLGSALTASDVGAASATHDHTVSEITDFPSIPDVSVYQYSTSDTTLLTKVKADMQAGKAVIITESSYGAFYYSCNVPNSNNVRFVQYVTGYDSSANISGTLRGFNVTSSGCGTIDITGVSLDGHTHSQYATTSYVQSNYAAATGAVGNAGSPVYVNGSRQVVKSTRYGYLEFSASTNAICVHVIESSGTAKSRTQYGSFHFKTSTGNNIIDGYVTFQINQDAYSSNFAKLYLNITNEDDTNIRPYVYYSTGTLGNYMYILWTTTSGNYKRVLWSYSGETTNIEVTSVAKPSTSGMILAPTAFRGVDAHIQCKATSDTFDDTKTFHILSGANNTNTINFSSFIMDKVYIIGVWARTTFNIYNNTGSIVYINYLESTSSTYTTYAKGETCTVHERITTGCASNQFYYIIRNTSNQMNIFS